MGFCLKGTDFQFGKRTKFWRWMVGWLHNSENLMPLNCMFTMAQRAHFMLCVFYHH